jgi:hypothetical protein
MKQSDMYSAAEKLTSKVYQRECGCEPRVAPFELYYECEYPMRAVRCLVERSSCVSRSAIPQVNLPDGLYVISIRACLPVFGSFEQPSNLFN